MTDYVINPEDIFGENDFDGLYWGEIVFYGYNYCIRVKDESTGRSPLGVL